MHRGPRNGREAAARGNGALFVGRAEPLARLVALVEQARQAPRIAVIVGPAGAGKSALARELLLRFPRHRAIWLSSERIALDAASCRCALSESTDGLEGLGRGDGVDLLVIDAFDRSQSVERWLFQDALPRAGARLGVILTRRESIDASTPGRFAAVTHELALPPLKDAEARGYLRRRGVPDSALDVIVGCAAGHALTLALIGDRYALERGYRFEARPTPNLVASLVDEIVRAAPSIEHESALHALSVPSALDEELLGAMLGLPCAPATELYSWLRSFTFVEHDGDRLIPQALVRTLLFDDLALKNPERLRRILDGALQLVRRPRCTPRRSLARSNEAPSRVPLSVELTERQRAVLHVLLSGKSNKEIAVALRCSESTVEFHVTTLLRKNAVTSRTELIAKLLAPNEPADGVR